MTTLFSSSFAEHPLLTPPSIATTTAVSDPLLFPSHDSFPESPSYANVIISPLEDSPTISSSDGAGGSGEIHEKLREYSKSEGWCHEKCCNCSCQSKQIVSSIKCTDCEAFGKCCAVVVGRYCVTSYTDTIDQTSN
ncbi:PX domain-containing protein [Forsythia ovata]|uniref:PX domain-containing protein n=1 Tax=Forsythia ovata TaxID=205694 RepID=A0ABD1SMF5_9LAMI